MDVGAIADESTRLLAMKSRSVKVGESDNTVTNTSP